MHEEKEKLNSRDLEGVTGGYGYFVWEYTAEEYEKAGVEWQHISSGEDHYHFRGIEISRSCAGMIGDFYYTNGRQPTDIEFQLIRSKNE